MPVEGEATLLSADDVVLLDEQARTTRLNSADMANIFYTLKELRRQLIAAAKDLSETRQSLRVTVGIIDRLIPGG